MERYASKRTLWVLTIGILCIMAIAMGAATITSTLDVSPDRITSDDDDHHGQDFSGSDEIANQTIALGESEARGQVIDLQRCVEPLDSVPGTLMYFTAFFVLLYFIKARYTFGAALLAGYGLAPFVLTAYFLTTQCAERGEAGVGDGIANGGVGGAGEQMLVSPEIPPIAIFAAFGVLVVAAAVAVFHASSGQEVLPEEEEPERETDARDLADAAGAAADRIEQHNADVDNAVYEAWLEMTKLLDVPDPDTTTPGEFAAAAIVVGLSEEHVQDLTKLFEEVRYGGFDPEAREESALSVFRAIESEYGIDSDSDAASERHPPGDGE